MSADLPIVRVEFYGIPRARAGVAETLVELPGDTAELAYVYAVLAERLPSFGAECLCGGTLRDGFSANVGGGRFVRSAREMLRAGDILLIMSADAGG